MMAGSVLVVTDTLIRHHVHPNQHILTHTHGGLTHTHMIIHTHGHDHILSEDKHNHKHNKEDLERVKNFS